MAKFISDNDLNAELSNILKEAKEILYLISPYIKLHPRFKNELKKKMSMPDLEITVVFGKNEDDLKKSLNLEDLAFLVKLPNIRICYEPRLHAKYYGNEDAGLITSMNLYDFSQNNNIETGVLTKTSLFGGGLDMDAFKYFTDVVENSEVIFEKEPVSEESEEESKIVVDKLEKSFGVRLTPEYDLVPASQQRLSASAAAPSKANGGIPNGYCIRTGVPIPFNVERPFSYEAYQRWSKYADENYVEKFCHFSGDPSGGETSFAKPILKKHWKAAKVTHGL